MADWTLCLGQWVQLRFAADSIRDRYVVVSEPYRAFGETVVDAIRLDCDPVLERLDWCLTADRDRFTAAAFAAVEAGATSAQLNVAAIEPARTNFGLRVALSRAPL